MSDRPANTRLSGVDGQRRRGSQVVRPSAAIGRFGARVGSVAPRTLRRALGWPLVGQDRCLVKRTDLAVHHDPATAVGRGPR